MNLKGSLIYPIEFCSLFWALKISASTRGRIPKSQREGKTIREIKDILSGPPNIFHRTYLLSQIPSTMQTALDLSLPYIPRRFSLQDGPSQSSREWPSLDLDFVTTTEAVNRAYKIIYGAKLQEIEELVNGRTGGIALVRIWQIFFPNCHTFQLLFSTAWQEQI